MQLNIHAKLEQRIRRVHERQRLGIDQEHEQRVFGDGLNFFHLENWYSIHSVIRNSLKLTGLYWRGCRNAERIQVRHNLIERADIPALFNGITILNISDFHLKLNEGAMRCLI